jgi:hypothetical protein
MGDEGSERVRRLCVCGVCRRCVRLACDSLPFPCPCSFFRFSISPRERGLHSMDVFELTMCATVFQFCLSELIASLVPRAVCRCYGYGRWPSLYYTTYPRTDTRNGVNPQPIMCMAIRCAFSLPASLQSPISTRDTSVVSATLLPAQPAPARAFAFSVPPRRDRSFLLLQSR